MNRRLDRDHGSAAWRRRPHSNDPPASTTSPGTPSPMAWWSFVHGKRAKSLLDISPPDKNSPDRIPTNKAHFLWHFFQPNFVLQQFDIFSKRTLSRAGISSLILVHHLQQNQQQQQKSSSANAIIRTRDNCVITTGEISTASDFLVKCCRPVSGSEVAFHDAAIYRQALIHAPIWRRFHCDVTAWRVHGPIDSRCTSALSRIYAQAIQRHSQLTRRSGAFLLSNCSERQDNSAMVLLSSLSSQSSSASHRQNERATPYREWPCRGNGARVLEWQKYACTSRTQQISYYSYGCNTVPNAYVCAL